MAESNQRRADQMMKLGVALRTASAKSTLISQAVADAVGLTPTALECLDLIQLRGRATAGELARHTGLTTGAVTSLIDRLEHAGYVTRERDPHDRRRVYVSLRPESIGALAGIYHPLQAATERLFGRYSTAELSLITDFTERSAAIASDFVRSLRDLKIKNPT
ncbi:MAG TPA: MarR family transcriptional regulator [Rhizobiaceae bacterium]|nr:MarR family transcriptional regulator [Rhizobiaceae bacterium]